MTRLPHRPYALVARADRLPSVTEVLKLLPKPGLPWGAARETAVFAVLHPDRWQHEPDAVDVLRKHHKGIWDGRAAMGTLAHGVLEAYCAGQDVNLDHLVEQTIATDSNARTWRDRDRDDLIEQVLGYVLGIERWWADFLPTCIRSEVVVRWPGLFIGQTDLRCVIDGHDTLVDLKSSSVQDEDKGLYPDSWALQLAAYGMARETVDYEVDDAPDLKRGFRVREVGTGEWSRPERYAVVHVRGDERYAFYEIPVTRETERTFLRLARAYPHVTELAKTQLNRIQKKEQAA